MTNNMKNNKYCMEIQQQQEEEKRKKQLVN